MQAKRIAVSIVVGLGLAGGGAWAAQYVASVIGGDGVIHGCYVQRTGALRVVDAGVACAKGELAIQWNQTGPTGPTGPQGVPGPPGDTGPQGPPGPTLTTLAGIPCDTGSLDKPDGRTHVSVDAATGALSLTCLTSSTNPVLTLELDSGPVICGSFFGFPTGCIYSYYDAQQVDANNVAVPNGFTCVVTTHSDYLGEGIPFTCQSRRFTAGTALRFGAIMNGIGGVPLWTGCDSVSGMTCVVTVPSGGKTVTLTPVASG